jgi:hypothetical protein
MSALKFECPACGQNLECSRACCGDIIHCPRCCAELRIPFSSDEIPGSVARAELIMHAPAAPAPANTSATAAAPPPKPESTELVCPVCLSHLRARGGSVSSPTPPLAELIRKGPTRAENPPPPENKPEEVHPDFAHMSLQERERQIAAAREAHPIQLNQPIKPRLDYVLSDQAAPVQKKQSPDQAADNNGTLAE